jgi:hypothetical protein
LTRDDCLDFAGLLVDVVVVGAFLDHGRHFTGHALVNAASFFQHGDELVVGAKGCAGNAQDGEGSFVFHVVVFLCFIIPTSHLWWRGLAGLTRWLTVN